MRNVKIRHTGQHIFVVADLQDRELIVECSTGSEADQLKIHLMQAKSIVIVHKGPPERYQKAS